MLQGMRIAVVIPAFNVAGYIEQCLLSVPLYVDRIIVVDDASFDDTVDRTRQSANPRLTLLLHGRNRGVGAAIMTGYLHAARDGMDIAVVMAGDGQMHPDDMAGLLLPLLRGEADYVKGNRLAWPGHASLIPFPRLVGIKALERLTRLSTGFGDLNDFQCGYTALKLSVLARIEPHKVYPRYGFPNDLLNHLALARARVAERPVRPVYRGQPSHLRIPRVILPIFMVVLRGAFRRWRYDAARSNRSRPGLDFPAPPLPAQLPEPAVQSPRG